MNTPTDDVEVYLEGRIRHGCWVTVTLGLADGSKLEIRVPGVVSTSAVSSAYPLGERAVICFTDSSGKVRTGRLSQMGL